MPKVTLMLSAKQGGSVNLTAQFYGNAAHPTGGSPWGMRLQIAFLFPTAKK